MFIDVEGVPGRTLDLTAVCGGAAGVMGQGLKAPAGAEVEATVRVRGAAGAVLDVVLDGRHDAALPGAAIDGGDAVLTFAVHGDGVRHWLRADVRSADGERTLLIGNPSRPAGLPSSLWAGFADIARTRPWERDTVVCVLSATKLPLIIAFLMLIDRGLVDLNATVASYWPEFAQGGKAHVTVREAMSHRAGVPGFDPPLAFEAMHDWAACTDNIAAQTHWFGGEAGCFYHFVTYGYGALARSCAGSTVSLPSRFFREEIAGKAGTSTCRLACSRSRTGARGAAFVAAISPTRRSRVLNPGDADQRKHPEWGQREYLGADERQYLRRQRLHEQPRHGPALQHLRPGRELDGVR